MLLSHTLTMREVMVEFGLVKFFGLGGDSVTDRWMEDRRADGQMHGKINVALAQPYYEGKWCSNFDWILPSG